MMRDDLDAVASDWPASMTWGAQTIAGTVSPIDRTDDVAGEGVFNLRTCEFVARLDAFTDSTPPDVRVKVTVDGTAYHVDSKKTDEACVHLFLRRV